MILPVLHPTPGYLFYCTNAFCLSMSGILYQMVVLLSFKNTFWITFSIISFNIHRSDIEERHCLTPNLLGVKKMIMKHWDDNLITNSVSSCMSAFSNDSVINKKRLSLVSWGILSVAFGAKHLREGLARNLLFMRMRPFGSFTSMCKNNWPINE